MRVDVFGKPLKIADEYAPEAPARERKCANKRCRAVLNAYNKFDHCSLCYGAAYKAGYYNICKKPKRAGYGRD